jgi:uncharacterized protein
LPGTEQQAFGVVTLELDLPAVAGAFGNRLRSAGLPVGADLAIRFARALELVRPISRRRLYWAARAVFVSDRGQVKAFDAVFRSVFGGPTAPSTDAHPDESTTASAGDEAAPGPAASLDAAPLSPGSISSSAARGDPSPVDADSPELPVALSPSEEEVLRQKRFDSLSTDELRQLNELMKRMRLEAPLRRTRRAERYRLGERIDLRRTLRGSLRTGGDPVRVRRRRRRIVPRRIVLLCDISGSMEPYARAYLQFLSCAAGGARRAEAFVFATRLTRVTRALEARNPDRAIKNAAAAAPDWSSGTRIGDALKLFNDRHGRRGMARGAVIVILSDGWERGDPEVVAREMERLSRLAHRIVWVNPRAGAEGFLPRAGGMAAALPHVDALVSGHNLTALGDVVDAIAGGGSPSGQPPPVPEEADEPWASATPTAGSSVAMPSGYGPKRGHTAPGWSHDS